MSAADARIHAFDGYRVDTVARQLLDRDGTPLALSAKAFDVLLYLIGHRDRIVSKEELLGQVWAGRVVEENNLTQAVSALRRALGVAAGDHRYVVTVPGRGYRFVAAMEDGADAPAADGGKAVPGEPGMPSSTSRRRRWMVPALAVLIAALLTAALLRDRPSGSAGLSASAAPDTTLAVLPFRPIGQGERDEMLELGLAETLISRLSRSTRLRVLSLGSVQGFLGAAPDPLRTGRALGADYIVEGSIQRLDGALRINARLLSLPDGRTVWAGTFDQKPDRVFTVQDALAEAVSSALSQRYAGNGFRSPCDGEDPLAYRAYLRGQYLLNRPDAQRLDDAIAGFHEAIGRDPACARAWAGSAYARRALVMVADRDPRVEFPLSYAEIAQALAIDPGSAEAHTAMGFNRFWYDWDWDGAEASLLRALELNPNLVDAHYALAHLYDNVGRHQEALVRARHAMGLDPLSPLVNVLSSSFVANAGHVEEAMRQVDRVVELEPYFWIARLFRARMSIVRGDAAGAMEDLHKAVELSGRNSQSVSRLAMAEAQAGRRDAAIGLLRELEQREGYVPPTRLAAVHLALGDTGRALDLLEQGYGQRDIGIAFLRLWFGALHAEPRYQALLRRMALADPLGADGPPPSGE